MIVVPNFTPAKWFECDLFSVSKSRYWTEHEIKLTVGDFKADAEKKQYVLNGDYFEWKSKYSLLTEKDNRGPSSFWYVLSTDVARQVTIPEWAGLKVVAFSARAGYLNLNVMKAAPRLHKVKVSDGLMEQASVAMYWRYWRMRLGHKEPKEMEHDHGREDQGNHQSVHE